MAGPVTAPFSPAASGTPVAAATLSVLRTMAGGAAPSVQLQGQLAAGDGGDRLLHWQASNAAADDGVTVIAPAGSSGAGRWVATFGERRQVNVLWCGAAGDGVTNDTAAFVLARSVANSYGVPIYVPEGRSFLINWQITDNGDIWLTGGGTLLWAKGANVINVQRPAPPTIAVTTQSSVQVTVQTVTNNVGLNEGETVTALTVANPSAVTAGQIYMLSSQDAYAWSAQASGNQGSIWQAQMVRVQGIGVPFSGGTGAMAEEAAVTGSSSGAIGTIKSVAGTSTGTVIFNSISANFTAGENLTIGGTTVGVVAAAPLLLIADRVYDTFTTSPTLQLITQSKCIIEGVRINVPAGADPEAKLGLYVNGSSGALNRQPGIILAGCWDPQIKGVTVVYGWTRAIQVLSCWGGDADLQVQRLPDDANTSEAAYGYGIELAGCTHGMRVRIKGSYVRHLFTTNCYWGGFQYMTPWLLGTPKHCLIHDSHGSNTFNAPFDTHWGCYFMVFEGCTAQGVSYLNRNVSANIGFQNRGFGTQYVGCTAHGTAMGFNTSAENLSNGFTAVTSYRGCSAIDFQFVGFVCSVNAISSNQRIEYIECLGRGDGRAVNAPFTQAPFYMSPGNTVRYIRCRAERFNNTPFYLSGGYLASGAWSAAGRIYMQDCFADYSECPSQATGIKIVGVPVQWIVNGYTVRSDPSHSSAPNALISNRIASSTGTGYQVPLLLAGTVGCLDHETPLLDTTEPTAVTLVTWRASVSLAIPNPRPAYQANQWDAPAGVPVQGTPAVGVLTALPFAVRGNCSMTALGVYVGTASTGGTSLIRLGLYADNGGRPGALLLDGGTVGTDTVGTVSVTTALALTRGLVWVASQQAAAGTAAVQMACVGPGSSDLQRQIGASGLTALLSATAPVLGIVASGYSTVGALPAAFPSPTQTTAGPVPMVGLLLSPVVT